MIVFFLAGILNIAVGIGIAYLLAGHSSLRGSAKQDNRPMLGKVTAKIFVNEEAEATEQKVTGEQPKDDHVEGVPKRWLELLGEVATRIETIEEAAALVANRQIEDVVKKMISIDERLKCSANSMSEWTRVIGENRQFLEDWCECNRQFLEELRGNNDAIDTEAEYWIEFDQIVQKHISATEQLNRQIDDAGPGADQNELLEEMRKSIPMICEFRDQIDAKLASNYVGENSVEIRDRSIRIDQATGVYTRAGISTIFKQWWENDPSRDRVATIALFDICGTESINRRFGYEIANQIIASFIEKLQGCTRQNRGFDRLARYTGQQVFMFLGDTSLSNAIRTVSRFCEVFQSLEFHVGDEVIFLPANATITPLFKDDQIEFALNRLERALPIAKENGPNAQSVFDDEPRLATEEECRPLSNAPVSIA